MVYNLVAIITLQLIAVVMQAQSITEVQKIVASDRAVVPTHAWFGYTSAISGDYSIVGSYQKGVVHIFKKDSASVWHEMQEINFSGPTFWIHSVDIWGTRVIIARQFVNATIYEQDSTGIWNEVQLLTSGNAVAIDSNYAIVGSPYDGNVFGEEGSASIYERDSVGNWNFVQEIGASDNAPNDHFGYAVSISGNTAVVGARDDDDSPIVINLGSAYIFQRDSSGSWNQVQKIVASDREGNDEFGYAVDIFDNYCIIGAYREDDDTAGTNSMTNSGSAYLFERNAQGTWNEVQKIVASDRAIGDQFGNSVSINGSQAIIGALGKDGIDADSNFALGIGNAYLFEKSQNGRWIEINRMEASDKAGGDAFGSSVSISGNTAIVGAYGEDEDISGLNTLNEAGSAYIFEFAGPCNPQVITINAGWNLISSYIQPSNDSIPDIFNEISSEILLVKSNQGQTYIPSLAINNIGNWEIEQGYLVKASAPTTLIVSCKEIDPTTAPIQLNSGWNMIAYLRNSPMDCNLALADILSDIIMVKDINGNSFIPSLGINTIGDMVPGQGYKIKMNNSATLVYLGN